MGRDETNTDSGEPGPDAEIEYLNVENESIQSTPQAEAPREVRREEVACMRSYPSEWRRRQRNRFAAFLLVRAFCLP